jgi:hypothetical protein
MDLVAREGVPPAIAQVLSDDLVAEVRRRRQRSQVISAEEIRSMLAVVGTKQKLGCAGDKDVSCLAEIGGALGAEQMVNGTIGKLSNTYVFSLKLIDVSHARVLRSASINLATRDDAQLLSAARAMVAQLFPDLQLAPQSNARPELIAEASVQPSPEPRSHSHLPAVVIGIAGLAAGGVAVFGLTQVLAYNNDVNAINSNQTGIHYSSFKSDQSSAQIWQPLGIALGAVGLGALTAAVILW